MNKNTNINLNVDPFAKGQHPPAQLPEQKCINVNGREEHEAILRDSVKCKELGIDPVYESIVYLRRWGSWLEDETLS